MNALSDYILHLADNSLILAQRNSEWCGHGPVLEQDIAITNISLDLIGQARNFYQYAASLLSSSKQDNGKISEDTLAYLRTEREFKNCLLVEQPNGDWARTILRQYFFSQFQYLLFEELQQSRHEQLAAIAAKSIKEVAYHLRWSREWVIRLGDGTDESHQRMEDAVGELWRYTHELFEAPGYEGEMIREGTGADISKLKEPWMQAVKQVFEEATLTLPVLSAASKYLAGAGKEGIHTEHLGHLLTELQYMQRAYPGCEW